MAKTSNKKSLSKKDIQQTSSDNKSTFGNNACTTVEELFLGELKDTLWAENHLVKAIPKMIDAAASAELKEALTQHLEITKGHSKRLEQIFELLGKPVQAKKCDALEGLVMSGEHVIENTLAGTPVRDTGIIMSGLKVEDFETTTYKGLVQTAQSLGKNDIADLLQQNMNEEIEATNVLEGLSSQNLN